MSTKTIKSIIITIIVSIIPCYIASISSFIIAGYHSNTTCGTSFIPLQSWLFVQASHLIIQNTLIIVALAFVIYFLAKSYDEEDAVSQVMYEPKFQSVLATSGLFSFVWHIMGAIALFRDSMECMQTAKSLWTIVLVCLILYWNSCIYGLYMWNTHKKRAGEYIQII